MPQFREEVKGSEIKKPSDTSKDTGTKGTSSVCPSTTPRITLKGSYRFHVTVFQPRQIRRTRNRDFSWGWVRPANKLIKCPVTPYSWGEKQTGVLQEVVQTTVGTLVNCSRRTAATPRVADKLDAPTRQRPGHGAATAAARLAPLCATATSCTPCFTR